MKYSSLLLLLVVTACGCDTANRTPTPGTTTTQRDNSAVTPRNNNGTATTPLDQNENQKDIDITAQIRKQVVDTKMSVNAHNVKIMTQNGMVTLRGPVETTEEKSTIETIARKVAGDTKVDNQLDVASPK